MSYIVNSGNPFLRHNDPMPVQVNPRGLQPQSSYSALLAYASGQTDSFATNLAAPPDALTVEILLFGCDYPQRFTGTQYYSETYLPDGAPTSIYGMTFTLPALPVGGLTGISALPDLLATQVPAASKFQEKVTGETITEGVTLTGFPFLAQLLGHDLWADDTGSAGDRAGYTAELNMALENNTTNGPAAFLLLDGETVQARQPVILWEPDFTQQIVDDGFKINATQFNGYGAPFVLDVVGIWSGIYYVGETPTIYSPLPGMTPAVAKLAAPAEGAAPVAHPYAPLFAALKKKV
jgi:hypothetical protein